MTVRRLSVLLKAKPATPPERSAGVAPVVVQNGTRPEVSDVEVLTGNAPAAAPVIVMGELPRILNAVQDTVPAHEAVVVGVAVRRRDEPLPVTTQLEGKVVVPVPPWGIVSCAEATRGKEANTATASKSSFFIITIVQI